MRGGYRPGSGPKKGTKYKTDSEVTPEQHENDIRLMLSFGARLMDGGGLTNAESKQLEEIGARLGPLTRAERMLVESLK